MRSSLATAVIGLAVIIYCVPILGATRPEVLRDRRSSERPMLLVVGTAHFTNPGRDLVNPQVDDVTTPGRQVQIGAVVRELAEFRPSHVVLEWPATEQKEPDRRYDDYLAGRAQLGRSEKEQLGLRLAKLVGLKRVDAVDWNGPPPVLRQFARESGTFHVIDVADVIKK